MFKQKKYYRTSDLINDYIKLQGEFDNYKRDNLKQLIWIFRSFKEGGFKPVDLDKIIIGFSKELKEYG